MGGGLLASEATGASFETIKAALTTAFTTVSSNISDVIAVALPIALALVGTVLAINIGIKFFKKITGKA